MAWYRVYFLNNSRRISDVAEIRSSSDQQALDDARALLTRRGDFPAFELWQEARPIFLFPQTQAA